MDFVSAIPMVNAPVNIGTRNDASRANSRMLLPRCFCRLEDFFACVLFIFPPELWVGWHGSSHRQSSQHIRGRAAQCDARSGRETPQWHQPVPGITGYYHLHNIARLIGVVYDYAVGERLGQRTYERAGPGVTSFHRVRQIVGRVVVDSDVVGIGSRQEPIGVVLDHLRGASCLRTSARNAVITGPVSNGEARTLPG